MVSTLLELEAEDELEEGVALLDEGAGLLLEEETWLEVVSYSFACATATRCCEAVADDLLLVLSSSSEEELTLLEVDWALEEADLDWIDDVEMTEVDEARVLVFAETVLFSAAATAGRSEVLAGAEYVALCSAAPRVMLRVTALVGRTVEPERTLVALTAGVAAALAALNVTLVGETW